MCVCAKNMKQVFSEKWISIVRYVSYIDNVSQGMVKGQI